LAIYAHPLEYAEHSIFEGMGKNSHDVKSGKLIEVPEATAAGK